MTWYSYGLICTLERSSAREERQGNAQKLVKRIRMHILYAGKVQGVGFRYTTKKVALGFEVTGQVRNLPDGRVELLAEGLKEELEAFRAAIHDAGLRRIIQDEQVMWEETENKFRGFEISS